VLSDGGGDIDEILTVGEIEQFLKRFPKQFRELGLLGGEPFLYPHLGSVLELLWKERIMPKIFTSATNPLPECLQALEITNDTLLSFIVNIGTRDSYTVQKYNNLIRFFSKFHAQSSLSYTIFDLNVDPGFLFDIIDEFRLTRLIRVGVALPIYKGGNEYIPKEKYKELGRFFAGFARLAYERQVVLGMDCGFVACMFTPTDIGALQRHGVRMGFCCGAAIDIGPKLEAWNCFPLFRLHKEQVMESETMHELMNKFSHRMEDYFNHTAGIFDACKECKYFKRKVCEGGCKSFKSM
jgi:radical SAM protein with 4Fe4S-binding SPASM domain